MKTRKAAAKPTTANVKPTPEQRFDKQVTKQPGPDGCHTFRSLGTNGYGVFFRDGRSYLAHRYAFEQASGQRIPPGLNVLHSCDNRACVRKSHLRLGSQRENMADKIAKGRHRSSGIRRHMDADERNRIYKALDSGASGYVVAKEFGRTEATISRLRKHRNRYEEQASQAEKRKIGKILDGLHQQAAELSNLSGTPITQQKAVIEMPRRKREVKELVAVIENFQAAMRIMLDEFNPKAAA